MIKAQPISRFLGLVLTFPVLLNAASLSSNPTRYVPQYGGFCAYHLSKGNLKDSDPADFFIYKNKLYVCSAADGAKKFRSNIDENIQKADENWLPLGRAEGQPYSRGPR
jgi:hypothetical protein